MTEDGIGVPLRRREDRRFLTGRGRYVHDIVLPQQLHAVFLRSPHAHAEIVAIEKAEALASPGVAAIFTAEDVTTDKLNGVPCAWGIAGKDGNPMKEPPHPLLARGKVRHVGDPVARATKPAGQHRRHPPRRPAPAARPTLSRSPLTPASPAPRPRRNQAGRWNLSLLPPPHRPRRYRSALPCYSDRDHPGARINEKSLQEVSRVRSLETNLA